MPKELPPITEVGAYHVELAGKYAGYWADMLALSVRDYLRFTADDVTEREMIERTALRCVDSNFGVPIEDAPMDAVIQLVQKWKAAAEERAVPLGTETPSDEASPSPPSS